MKMIAEFLLSALAHSSLFRTVLTKEVDLCGIQDGVLKYVDTLFLIGHYF
jgi:hypothetical protein